MKRMNGLSRARLALENLESRWCPAIAWSNVNDILTITGDPVSTSGLGGAGELTITQTAAGVYSLADGPTTLATLINANKGVSVTLNGDDEFVYLDGAVGTPITGNVSINTGNGRDIVYIANAVSGLTIAGMLLITTGNGENDIVEIDRGGGGVVVQGPVSINGGLGASDELTLNDTATVQGDLTTQGVEAVFADGDVQGRATIVFNNAAAPGNDLIIATTSALGSLTVTGTGGEDLVDLDGDVLGATTINLSNGENTFNHGADAVIGGLLQYTGGSGDDTLALEGRVNGAATVNLGSGGVAGNDFDLLATGQFQGSLTMSSDGGVTDYDFIAGSLVAGNLSVTTRSTAATFDMLGVMAGSRFTYTGGGGRDQVTWAATNGAAYLSVNLGSGGIVGTPELFDLVTANYNRGVIDGSFGTDNFNNTAAAIGLTVRGFEL